MDLKLSQIGIVAIPEFQENRSKYGDDWNAKPAHYPILHAGACNYESFDMTNQPSGVGCVFLLLLRIFSF